MNIKNVGMGMIAVLCVLALLYGVYCIMLGQKGQLAYRMGAFLQGELSVSKNKTANGKAYLPNGVEPSNVVYYQEDNSKAYAFGGHNIFYIDNSSVKRISSPNHWADIKAIVISPVSVNIVYAATSSSLYKSTNGGKTWTKIATPAGVVIEGITLGGKNGENISLTIKNK